MLLSVTASFEGKLHRSLTVAVPIPPPPRRSQSVLTCRCFLLLGLAIRPTWAVMEPVDLHGWVDILGLLACSSDGGSTPDSGVADSGVADASDGSACTPESNQAF